MNIRKYDSFIKYIEENASKLNLTDQATVDIFFINLQYYLKQLLLRPATDPAMQKELQFIKNYLSTFLSDFTQEKTKNYTDQMINYVKKIFSTYDESMYSFEVSGNPLLLFRLRDIKTQIVVKTKMSTSLHEIMKGCLSFDKLTTEEQVEFYITYAMLLHSELDNMIRKAYTMSDDNFNKPD